MITKSTSAATITTITTADTLSPQSSTKRLVSLDFLRGIAILMVLLSHMPMSVPLVAFPEEVHWLMKPVFTGGWSGVDLFFVLSGFLIANLLFAGYEKHNDLRLGRFLTRRGLKIWPPYALLLLGTFIFLLFNLSGDFVLRVDQAARYLTPFCLHFQNYTGPNGFIGHTWSLAVEEHFYLMLPLLLAGMVRLNRKKDVSAQRTGIMVFDKLPRVFLYTAVACLAMRVIIALQAEEFSYLLHLWPTHLRIDSLFADVVLAYTLKRYPSVAPTLSRYRKLLGLVGGAIFLLPMYLPLHEEQFMPTFGFSILWLGAVCLVLAAVLSEGARWME
jgi:peptidoglycan/LPS O-acetylase OafA/YrhL